MHCFCTSALIVHSHDQILYWLQVRIILKQETHMVRRPSLLKPETYVVSSSAPPLLDRFKHNP